MVLAMFLTATSSLVTNYMNSIIRVDSIHANSLSPWLLPGYVVERLFVSGGSDGNGGGFAF